MTCFLKSTITNMVTLQIPLTISEKLNYRQFLEKDKTLKDIKKTDRYLGREIRA